jgi:benzodiazapine receptor
MNQPASASRSLLALLGFLAITFAAPAIGAFWPPGDWFQSLAKPSWNPPSWLFGPVWTILYILMAIAAWRVWDRGGFAKQKGPLTLFFIQLVLNAAWTPLFFGAHQLLAAFILIIVMWAAILLTLLSFRRVDSVAAAMLIPYLAWVSFATVLNGVIWRMNS